MPPIYAASRGCNFFSKCDLFHYQVTILLSNFEEENCFYSIIRSATRKIKLHQTIVKMRLFFVNNHVSCFYANNLPQSHTGRVVNYMSKNRKQDCWRCKSHFENSLMQHDLARGWSDDTRNDFQEKRCSFSDNDAATVVDHHRTSLLSSVYNAVYTHIGISYVYHIIKATLQITPKEECCSRWIMIYEVCWFDMGDERKEHKRLKTSFISRSSASSSSRWSSSSSMMGLPKMHF